MHQQRQFAADLVHQAKVDGLQEAARRLAQLADDIAPGSGQDGMTPGLVGGIWMTGWGTAQSEDLVIDRPASE